MPKASNYSLIEIFHFGDMIRCALASVSIASHSKQLWFHCIVSSFHSNFMITCFGQLNNYPNAFLFKPVTPEIYLVVQDLIFKATFECYKNYQNS